METDARNLVALTDQYISNPDAKSEAALLLASERFLAAHYPFHAAAGVVHDEEGNPAVIVAAHTHNGTMKQWKVWG